MKLNSQARGGGSRGQEGRGPVGVPAPKRWNKRSLSDGQLRCRGLARASQTLTRKLYFLQRLRFARVGLFTGLEIRVPRSYLLKKP